MKIEKAWQADLALLGVTFVWGTTFVVIKDALSFITPFWFVALRFGLAFLVLWLIYGNRVRQSSKESIRLAGMIGLALFLGYVFQTIGLKYTSASNSGFITGLCLVFIPLLAWLWFKTPVAKATFWGLCLALLGMALLTIKEDSSLNLGDTLTLLGALAFGAHVVLVGHYAPQSDAAVLATCQIGVTALTSAGAAFITEPWPVNFSYEVWLALAVTAVPATALAFYVQNAVQPYTTSSRAALAFSFEPVFSAIAAYFWLGEIMTYVQMFGAALMFAGVIFSELGGGEQEAEEVLV